jgi:hypothetical protein
MTSVYKRAEFTFRSGLHEGFVGLKNSSTSFHFETHCGGSNDGMITEHSTGWDMEGSGLG